MSIEEQFCYRGRPYCDVDHSNRLATVNEQSSWMKNIFRKKMKEDEECCNRHMQSLPTCNIEDGKSGEITPPQVSRRFMRKFSEPAINYTGKDKKSKSILRGILPVGATPLPTITSQQYLENSIKHKEKDMDTSDYTDNTDIEDSRHVDSKQTRSLSVPSKECQFGIAPNNQDKPHKKKSPSLKRKLSVFDRKSSNQLDKDKTRSTRKMSRKFTTSAKRNLLQDAVVNKNMFLLDKILSNEDSINSYEINYLHPPGVTAFHQACFLGEIEVVQFLAIKGADLKLKTFSNLSPLKVAVMFGHFEVAEYLLELGADYNDIKNGFQMND